MLNLLHIETPSLEIFNDCGHIFARPPLAVVTITTGLGSIRRYTRDNGKDYFSTTAFPPASLSR